MAELKIARFADCLIGDDEYIRAREGVYTTPMRHSVAMGMALVSNGKLGVDAIHLRARDGFVAHTHPGDHILIVIQGRGTITFDGKVYGTEPGQVYMIDGRVPHAVGAIDEHTILAVGAPHRAVDATDRMAPVEYESVLAPASTMECLICGEVAAFPEYLLHELGCSQCNCYDCLSTGDPEEDARLRLDMAGLRALAATPR